MTGATYAKIVAKKKRMCGRFGHVPEPQRLRATNRRLALSGYYCPRCGATVSRETKREVRDA